MCPYNNNNLTQLELLRKKLNSMSGYYILMSQSLQNYKDAILS